MTTPTNLPRGMTRELASLLGYRESPDYDAPDPLDRFARPRVIGARAEANKGSHFLLENPLTGESMPMLVWAARIGIAPAALHDRLCKAPIAVALHAKPRQRLKAVRAELEHLLA
jgi:hypothetical protein